jgi:hypothetical protein
MKKVSLALVIASSLAVSASPAFAATTAPKPHVMGAGGAKEGTAKHEMSETSGTQKAEGSKSPKMGPKTVAKKKM